MADEERINVVGPNGWTGTIPREGLEKAILQGYRPETQDESLERAKQAQYGNSPITAGLEGAARGASFGLSDFVLPSVLGVSSEGLRERKERNATAATVGEVAGMVGPALLSGGASAAGEAGAAAGRVAEGALAKYAGGGILSRAAARAGTAAVQMGTEGALYGAGQGISDVALSQDPMSAEAIIGDLGHHILVGGGLGAVAGAGTSIAGTALGAAASKASKVIGRAASRMQGELEAGTQGMLSTTDPALRDEVMSMSRPQLEAAQKTETEAVQATRAQQGQAAAKDIERLYLDLKGRVNALHAQMTDKSVTVGIQNAVNSLGDVLDDPAALAAKPDVALRPLGRLGANIDKASSLLPEGALNDAQAADEATSATTASPIVKSDTGATVGPMPTPSPMSIPSSVTPAAGITKAETGTIGQRISDLYDRISDLSGNATSDRLQAISERLTALDKVPAKTPMLDAATRSAGGMIGGILGHATGIPGAGWAGAWMGKEFGDVLKPLMKRVLGSFVEHAAGVNSGVESFLSKLGAPGPAMDAVERLAAASGVSGESAYDRATKAITAAAADPEGTSAHLDRQLAGLQQAAPLTAQQVKQGILQVGQFLASKIPPAMQGFFGSPEPNDSDKATFARYAAAAEDPLRLIKELRAHMVMPETVETQQALYPEHFARLQQAILTQLADPKVRARVPYAMRLQLGQFMGGTIDPTLDPGFIATMQATQAPQLKPPGNKPPDPTAAQRLTTGGLQ